MILCRSLKFQLLPEESLLQILEQLAKEGYLQNNHKLETNRPIRSSRIVPVICSMKNLETLNFSDQDLALDSLAQVFQSCSKLTTLHFAAQKCKMSEMAELLKIQLRTGFQRLRYLDLGCSIDDDTWPMIQEMLTQVFYNSYFANCSKSLKCLCIDLPTGGSRSACSLI
jgi:hypothetical protein